MQLSGSHHSHDSGRFGLLRSSSQVVNHSGSYSTTPTLQDACMTSYYQSPSPSFGKDNDLGSTTDNKMPCTQGFWRNHQDPHIWSVMEPALHSFHFLMLTGDIFGNHMVMFNLQLP
ncbi:hypothetical protein BS47DRAFT_520439 [Hydnum rufescens UP504]|uniref:Uncharacterized protein n=1 Tax=Hydnum rufescens UP504 TaxID=1448309 RepID=A0A9P6AH00_9AGAM|nr:hypothetical protein BS47DRAFT_520439 [Hydnum rufescens UP504]